MNMNMRNFQTYHGHRLLQSTDFFIANATLFENFINDKYSSSDKSKMLVNLFFKIHKVCPYELVISKARQSSVSSTL